MMHSHVYRLKLSTIGVIVRICLAGSFAGMIPTAFSEQANVLHFDPNALDPRGGGTPADLDIFALGGQLPGTYHVDIYLNRSHVATRDIVFKVDQNSLRPQLTVKDLSDIGINTSAFPALIKSGTDKVISNLGEFIPEATSHFDFNHQRLDLQVPQASLSFDARNRVDPALWDQGISALLMNYNLTGAKSSNNGGQETTSAFLNLTSGANFGAWRLRNNSTYAYSKSSGSQREWYTNGNQGEYRTDSYHQNQSSWNSINTYLQRDVQSFGGQMTLGEGTTPGTLFDSTQFRGAQLVSDDSMLPDSMRGFAPIIRGIANSSAQVTIRQNGYIIYQTYVAPGPFAIRDLYPTAGSGDLQITVREEGGREHTFTQPFSSVPLMQRVGRLRYELTAGQYRTQSHNSREPGFGEASLIYGLSNTTTVYGGTTLSPAYISTILGIGKGLGRLGSVSLDVTQANTKLQDKSQHQGQSYRIQYAKDVFQSGTTFMLAGYRYSTSGFYDFREANEITSNEQDDWHRGYNKRSKMQVQISQTLGDYGSMYVNAYQQAYWGLGGRERSLGVGYNFSLKGISVGLSVNNTQTPGVGSQRQYALNVQVPLSRFLPNSWANFGTQTSSNHRTSGDVTVTGLALENNNLNYSVRESQSNQGEGNGGGVSLGYKGHYGDVQGAYSYTKNSRQYTGGFQGGIIVHPYGVTFAQPLGETVTLVRAPGASNVKIENQTGVSTDWRGYAVVPYAVGYRENRVALAPDSLGDDVDISETVKTVIPTHGAIVLADFKTHVGSRALVTLLHEKKPVPFGATATVINSNGNTNSSIVGDHGEVYLNGVPDKAKLSVSWGHKSNESCVAILSLIGTQVSGGVKVFSAQCV